MVTATIDEGLILNCYKLASYYHLDPRIFLDMPISEVQLHLRRTIEVEQSRKDEN